MRTVVMERNASGISRLPKPEQCFTTKPQSNDDSAVIGFLSDKDPYNIDMWSTRASISSLCASACRERSQQSRGFLGTSTLCSGLFG